MLLKSSNEGTRKKKLSLNQSLVYNQCAYESSFLKPERVNLRGAYVTLEPLSLRHTEELWSLARENAGSWQFLPIGPFNHFAAFRIYTALLANSTREQTWCVRPHDALGKPGALSGWISLLDARPAHAAVELGNVWFPPPFAHTRATTEAKALLLAHAFETLCFLKVSWRSHVNNFASRHAADRLGFVFDGVSRSSMIVKEKPWDIANYSFLGEEWPARRLALQAWLAPENFDAQGRQKRSLSGMS